MGDEENLDENGDPTLIEYKATGAEGLGHGVYNAIEGQKKIHDIQSQSRKQPERRTPEDEDEARAKAFEDGLKKAAKKAKKAKRVKKEKGVVKKGRKAGSSSED